MEYLLKIFKLTSTYISWAVIPLCAFIVRGLTLRGPEDWEGQSPEECPDWWQYMQAPCLVLFCWTLLDVVGPRPLAERIKGHVEKKRKKFMLCSKLKHLLKRCKPADREPVPHISVNCLRISSHPPMQPDHLCMKFHVRPITTSQKFEERTLLGWMNDLWCLGAASCPLGLRL